MIRYAKCEAIVKDKSLLVIDMFQQATIRCKIQQKAKKLHIWR
jgi:hypothetical protein